MKHGDKAKAKTAKSSSKASVKGSSPREKVKASKIVQSSKTSKAVEKERGAKTGPAPGAKTAGNGRPPGEGGFSNPAVAAAFRRAVKKYANAFRRLTD